MGGDRVQVRGEGETEWIIQETVEKLVGRTGKSKSVIEDKRQSLGIEQSMTEA